MSQDRNSIQAWAPQPDASFDLLGRPLSYSQMLILSKINGKRKMEEIIAQTGLSLPDFTTALGELIKMRALVEDAGAKAFSAEIQHRTAQNQPTSSHTKSEQEATPDHEPSLSHEGREQPQRDFPREETQTQGSANSVAIHGNPHKYYETELKPLAPGARKTLAANAAGIELSALCFDDSQEVIHALLNNPRTTLIQARLIAQVHFNSLGLFAFSEKHSFLMDPQVRVNLIRNPQSPEVVLRSIVSTLPLRDCFRYAKSKEVTEKAQRLAKEALRKKYFEAQPRERADIIIQTEGRCLKMLTGLPLGDRCAAILAASNISSVTLAFNLAAFPGLPTILIRCLLQQSVVRNNAQIKKLLNKQPNCTLHMKKDA